MDVSTYLLNHGIRPSVHRVQVMSYLLENRTHPTVEAIYAALSLEIHTLSKTTIYNILNLLVDKGVVQELSIDSRQCRYDGDMTPHSHFLCSECGELYDMNCIPLSMDTEHQIDEIQIYIKGTCKYCLTKKL